MALLKPLRSDRISVRDTEGAFITGTKGVVGYSVPVDFLGLVLYLNLPVGINLYRVATVREQYR